MRATSHLNAPIFYIRYAWFQLAERFSDFGSSIGFLLLYPFFVWLLTEMWGRFNAYQGNYSKQEVYTYLAITELLFMTFLRSTFMQRSTSDFSLTLARPRSWIGLSFFGQLGSTLGGRVIYLATSFVMLHLLGVKSQLILNSLYRLLILLPILGILEALMASVFASAQLLWEETRYFVYPITKIFLALGGVFGPLADYGEPGRSVFLKLLPSDLFFQVGHFCVKGEFYQLSTSGWLLRIIFWIGLFAIWNWLFFKFARKRHQSFGG